MSPLPCVALLAVAVLGNPQPDDPRDRRRPKPTAADVEAVAKDAADLAKELDKRSDYLFEALLAKDEKTRLKAAQALGKLGTRAIGARMTDILLKVIQADSSPAVRAEAILLVRDADFPGIRDAILAALGDHDLRVRESAVIWFHDHRSWPDRVVPALVRMLRASLSAEDNAANQRFRLSIFNTLSAYGPLAAEADQELVQSLKARRWEDRRDAFWVLVRVRNDKATLIPLFEERFAAKDPEDPELWAAVNSVSELGRHAEPLVPDLVRCLQYTLYKADRKKVKPHVDPLSLFRQFDELGPIARSAGPDLLKFFLDRKLPDGDRAYLLWAYSAVANPNREALQQIADEVVRRELLEATTNGRLAAAVRRLGPAVMPPIAGAWKRQLGNRELDHDMLWLCWQLRGASEPLLPILESFFVDPAAKNDRRPDVEADQLDRLARRVAKAIRDDPGQKAGVAPKR